MASTLTIVINSARSQADVARFIRETGQNREQCQVLERLFRRIEGGLESASFEISSAAVAPVRASLDVTITYAQAQNNDTITVAGQILTAVTGTPAATQQFKIETDATVTAQNLVALINSDAVTSLVVEASNLLGVVTIKSLVAGTVGNFIPLATSRTAAFAFTGGSTGVLASGVGGAAAAPVSFGVGR
jgi:hypothetical protein